ncbi:hypothetical protein [Pyrococcus yayanosii]|nr:hypothetical protein [Pyrococcus yayanosii]
MKACQANSIFDFVKILTLYIGYVVAILGSVLLVIAAIAVGSGVIGMTYVRCYVQFVAFRVLFPIIVSMYVHELFQYLPINAQVVIYRERMAFVWRPMIEVSQNRLYVSTLLGILGPFLIGLFLLVSNNGLEALPFLAISLSPILGKVMEDGP